MLANNYLGDILPMDGNRKDLPRLAGRRWEEYSGKQMLLSTFSGNGNVLRSPNNSSLSSLLLTPDTPLPRKHSDAAQPNHTWPAVGILPPMHPSLSLQNLACPPRFCQMQVIRQSSHESAQEIEGSQSKLSRSLRSHQSRHLAAREIHQGLLASATPSDSASRSKAAWSQLMAPIQPPNCFVHGDPVKEKTIHKPGPNKGKTFFLCASVYQEQEHSVWIVRKFKHRSSALLIQAGSFTVHCPLVA
ncbi:hypothetical protein DEU56DRAFT_761607 [Suillus clintonianus]|uniref:uncharacterized protein n=1 Tax=Suillus clintonianus TaxID=1904413 RepID=UPI001B882051|nr:uncharacterized protein DEU56DRAFT_761607 [Suillus clintonianus]KAG2116148.1 hypothetical protein DEU56DRAFT_761607 [Suillus clintonianus]